MCFFCFQQSKYLSGNMEMTRNVTKSQRHIGGQLFVINFEFASTPCLIAEFNI